MKLRPGEKYKGIGNCGMSDGVEITGILEYSQFNGLANLRDFEGRVHCVHVTSLEEKLCWCNKPRVYYCLRTGGNRCRKCGTLL